MMDKEQKIENLRNKISYLIEKLKVTNGQVDRSIINDKILEARREIGRLQSETTERIRRVDIVDAPPVADRLETQKKIKAGGFSIGHNNRITINL